MDSPIFECRISSLPRDISSWFVNFTFIDVLRRHISLAGYFVSGDDALHLSLPDRATVTESRMIRLIGFNSLSYDDIARITRGLYGLDVREEVCSDILREIDITVNESVRDNSRRYGGVIDVRVSKINSKVFERNENALVDRIVQRWIDMHRSEPKPIPANRSVIDSLETARYSPGSQTKGKDECIICMEDYREDSRISRLPCDHVYHAECIKQWLEINHKCPLCRFGMSH